MISSILGRRYQGFNRLSQEDGNVDENAVKRPQTDRKSSCHRIIAIVLCVTVAFISGVLFQGAWSQLTLETDCTRSQWPYSPVLNDVDIDHEIVHFNGSLLQENVFRKNAGPEVDAAWASLGVDYRSAIIPAARGASSGLTPAHVQVSAKYGGGFPANVEGLHHLHCLNLLRQSLYYNYDYYHKRGEGAFKNDDKIVRFHVSHCLDILRQQLMCNADVDVLGQVWWNRETPQAYPDFNTKHKCRNFDAVREWARIHQAPDKVPDDYLAAPLSTDDVYEAIP